VVIHGFGRDDQATGDVDVAEPLTEESKNLELTTGQAGRIVLGARPRSAGDRSNAERAKAFCDQARRRTGAQRLEDRERAA